MVDNHELYGMFIKPSKKWRNLEGNDQIMVPYTYYRLCESYRDESGIDVRWEELLRIMSAQQRVTMVAEQANGRLLKVRRSSNPEAKLQEIQKALGITPDPVCSVKSVWLREPPSGKDPPSKSGGWHLTNCNVG